MAQISEAMNERGRPLSLPPFLASARSNPQDAGQSTTTKPIPLKPIIDPQAAFVLVNVAVSNLNRVEMSTFQSETTGGQLSTSLTV
jgi:hypothetical protein